MEVAQENKVDDDDDDVTMVNGLLMKNNQQTYELACGIRSFLLTPKINPFYEGMLSEHQKFNFNFLFWFCLFFEGGKNYFRQKLKSNQNELFDPLNIFFFL